ncbi:protein kinase [Nonomuraea phyllanthi]|uniref:serine/threonine-protein kinase n=1 Tax=Nonomuraea phyllanthi TaxID=2219224 RepID=UPI001293B1B2|nr:serine/threonine-protein kinase [Nonomuraea phyllanthi]QFY10946.1 protein kinase [Nonomuraea phyllanthi]
MAVGPLRPGDPTAVGEFRVVGRLGQGGQGVVYLAESPDGGRAAVKVMTGGIDRAFARELAAARKVDEFCTARVLVADLDHDPPYVASEYIDGPALSAALSSAGPVRGAALTRLAIGTVTALAAIHRAGVVHRDFKPANVLLGPDGPRVIDFGVSRLVDASATRGTAMGTPPYMSPEQLSESTVGPASDMFAWGSTITFAATGRPPFGSDTFPAVAYRILNGDPDLGDLAEPLRGIVLRCLAKDPARRPTARTVLLELLGESPDLSLSAPSGPAVPGSVASGLGTLPPGASAAHSATGHEPSTPAPVPSPASAGVPGQDTAGPGAVADGRVGRRAVLLGLGSVTVAALATGGVVWWRTSAGARSVPQVPGTTALSATGAGSTTAPPQTGTPSEEAGTPTGQDATPSDSPAAEEPITAPPANGQKLAIAMETAISVRPMADMTFEGGLSQSDFQPTASGRIRFLPDAGYSDGSCDFDMHVTAPGLEPMDVVMRAASPHDLYIDRKRLGVDAEHDGRAYIDMIVAMSAPGVVFALVAHTTGVSRAGRRYSGGLLTQNAPTTIQQQLAGPAGWKLSDLEDTRLSWNLELDAANRPKSFLLSWRVSISGTELASTYATTYKKWREGDRIAAPR